MSDKNPYRIYYDNYLNTNAATELTGLIQNGEYSREEWDAYREIFNFEPVPHRMVEPENPGATAMEYSNAETDLKSPYKKWK